LEKAVYLVGPAAIRRTVTTPGDEFARLLLRAMNLNITGMKTLHIAPLGTRLTGVVKLMS
jgi:hypothetical protein